MRTLSFGELESVADKVDAVVAGMPDVDRFCSSTLWALPAHHAFLPERRARVFAGGAGYLLLAEAQEHGARIWQPLEAVWGLGCSVVTPDPAQMARELLELLRREAWDVVLLTGLVRGGELFNALAAALAPAFSLYLGPSARRYVAALRGGLDHFLSLRSANFRRNLVRAERRARAAGVVLETSDEPDAFARMLAVERRSWKGREGTGIVEPSMRRFYEEMVPRLHARGALRALFARLAGRDVGFLLGGVLGGTYRALQFAYDAEMEPIGLGNVMQAAQLERAAQEGLTHYDLGSEVPYKARWGELLHDTVSLIVRR